MVNQVWTIGEFHVLRAVVRPEGDDEPERENVAVELAKKAGVLVPDLVVTDSSCTLLDRPYTIYERARGVLLGSIDADPQGFERVYEELGREVAKIFSIEVPEGDVPKLHPHEPWDMADTVKRTVDAGHLSGAELTRIERLAARLERPEPDSFGFIHADIHPWNLFVDPDTGSLTGIIDWGDASWSDPAIEFASMPLVAIPAMFRGFRQAGGRVDEDLVARSLRRGLGLALWEVRGLTEDLYLRQWWRMAFTSWVEFADEVERLQEVLNR